MKRKAKQIRDFWEGDTQMKVVVSMQAGNHRKVYHQFGCKYANRIKPQNAMHITLKRAQVHGYRKCKYCSRVGGDIGITSHIAAWERTYHVNIDYMKQSHTLYIRTDMGCWKIFFYRKEEQYVLYHRNTYDPEMTLEEAIQGDYHRQTDVKQSERIEGFIHYISAHDKAKKIMLDDYRKLPRNTRKQRKYYNQAEKKMKRKNSRESRLRMERLFADIESKQPALKKAAIW